MGYFDDARQLIEYSRDRFPEIQSVYEASLSDQEIKPQLLIERQRFFL